MRIENENGESIALTGAEDRYQVVDIQGLSPPGADLYESPVSGMDGVKENDAKLQKRNLVMQVRINGNVERNRLNLYNYFRSKHHVKVYYRNGQRDVYIEGRVETAECGLFTNSQIMQVSIICADPYWRSVDEIVTDVSKVLGNFTFPFAFGANGIEDGTTTDDAIEFSVYLKDRIVNVINEGEDETGLTIRITARGEVVNPTIYNVTTREAFAMNITLVKGDVLTINTVRGHKYVTLLHETETVSRINRVIRDSTWITLYKGDNLITYDAEVGSSDMHVLFTHRTQYQGV